MEDMNAGALSDIARMMYGVQGDEIKPHIALDFEAYAPNGVRLAKSIIVVDAEMGVMALMLEAFKAAGRITFLLASDIKMRVWYVDNEERDLLTAIAQQERDNVNEGETTEFYVRPE